MSDSNDENLEFFDGVSNPAIDEPQVNIGQCGALPPGYESLLQYIITGIKSPEMFENIRILKESVGQIDYECLAAATKQYMDTKKEE